MASIDVHDISVASGSADFLGYDVSPANSSCSGTGKRLARIRSVACAVSSRRHISGRAMELVNGHESFSVLSNRDDLSILAASLMFAWASRLALQGSPFASLGG